MNPPRSPFPIDRRDAWTVAVLILTTLGVFAPVLGHQFLSWDDLQFVVGNPDVAGGTLAGLARLWQHNDPGFYIPLPYTAWWLFAAVFGHADPLGFRALNPLPYHVANWLLHAGVVALTSLLLRRLRLRPAAAALGAAAAGVHPLAVETVAWVMGLRDLMAVALGLIALLLAPRRPGVAAGVMLLAVLSKPVAIAVWPAAVALRCLDDDAAGPWRERLRAAWRATVPLALVAAFGVALTQVGEQGIHKAIDVLWQRPLIAADALAFYLRKAAWPWPLAFDYARTPASIFASGAAWRTWTVPAVVGIGLVLLRSRRAWLAAVLFVLPLGPVLGLVPFNYQSVSTVADRYAYASLLGVAVAVAAVADRWPRTGRAAVVAALLAWAVIDWPQQRAWADDATFFPFMAERSPASGPAWDGVARNHAKAGDYAAAAAAADRGIAAAPDYAGLRLTAARLAAVRGDPVACRRHLDDLERLYRRDADFEPGLMAKVRRSLGQ